MKARIISAWTGDGLTKSTARCPLVAARYSLGAWTDVTGSPSVPPDPNLLVVEATLTQATLDAIEADPDFYVLWSE